MLSELISDLQRQRGAGARGADQPADQRQVAERERRRPDAHEEVGLRRLPDRRAAAEELRGREEQRHLQRDERDADDGGEDERAREHRALLLSHCRRRAPARSARPCPCAESRTASRCRRTRPPPAPRRRADAPRRAARSPPVATRPSSGVVRLASIAGPAIANTRALVTWKVVVIESSGLSRHGRACPGHPRLRYAVVCETRAWTPARRSAGHDGGESVIASGHRPRGVRTSRMISQIGITSTAPSRK